MSIRRICALVIAIWFAGCGSSNQTKQLSADTIEQALFTVTATSCSADQTQSTTAFAIDTKTVVTVAHSFDKARSFQVFDHTNNVREATLMALDRQKDIALIELQDTTSETLSLSEEVPSDLLSFAHFEGSSVRLQKAAFEKQLSVSIDDGPQRAILELNATVQQGDSGSPVLNTNGEAVGMIFGTSKENPGTSWALASKEIHAVNNTINKPAALSCE